MTRMKSIALAVCSLLFLASCGGPIVAADSGGGSGTGAAAPAAAPADQSEACCGDHADATKAAAKAAEAEGCAGCCSSCAPEAAAKPKSSNQ
jgi:hypothetical protein